MVKEAGMFYKVELERVKGLLCQKNQKKKKI
jgi:hypothetical protein